MEVPHLPFLQYDAGACRVAPCCLPGRFLRDLGRQPSSRPSQPGTGRSPPMSASNGSSCRPIGRSATAISTNRTSATCRPKPIAASPAATLPSSLEAGDGAFTVRRDGKEVLTRTTPSDTADGRAWGGMLAELMAGSLDASPALQAGRPPGADPPGHRPPPPSSSTATAATPTPTRRATTASSATVAAASASPSSGPTTRRS